ncbi:MAG: PKD domain-containing protein [Bacteroidota bacterium]
MFTRQWVKAHTQFVTVVRFLLIFGLFGYLGASPLLAQTGEIEITGELKKWHPVTLTLDGPSSAETADPNPFLDYRLNVTFTQGATTIEVPGFFAADGDAANTSATSGTKWRARFTPHLTGTWNYELSFREGDNVAVDDSPTAGTPNSFDGITGSFTIGETDKSGLDFRARGTLRQVGEHYLLFDSGEWFISTGTGSPENFLNYEGFDNTFSTGTWIPKTYGSHIPDWNAGDPTWGNDEGKGIIGAINYLSSAGVNGMFMMVMNVQGDGKDTFPWIAHEDFFHFDVSKLEQWNIVFEHMNTKGVMPQLVLQEMEIEQLLDNGELGTTRTMFYREMMARFNHLNGVKWNIGEEHQTAANGGNTDAQRLDFVNYLTGIDAYDHPVVMHTSAGQSNYEALFGPFLGHPEFGGMSYHIHGPNNGGADTPAGPDTYKNAVIWRENSANAGRKWDITLDECCGWNTGVKPDQSNIELIRKDEMWGMLMAGTAGFSWYLGFDTDQRDLTLEDFRRYDFLWEYSDIAGSFFREYVPFVDMDPNDDLTPVENNHVLAKPGEAYVVWLRDGGTTTLDLEDSNETFMVDWYNPRTGGELISGAVSEITGPGVQSLGSPPFDTGDDWAVLVRSEDAISPIVARFTYQPGVLPFSVDFDATTSSSTDAAIVSYDWDFGDGMSGSGDMPSHTYSAPGLYVVTLTIEDALGNSDNQIQTIDVEDPNASGAFLEEDGLLVIEAENFEESITRNGQTWTESTTFSGFEGAGAMAALPDNGSIYSSGYSSSSPYMNFLADFTNTGTYFVWVRVRAVSSGNTLHVGLNESEVSTAESIESFNFSDWEWVRSQKSGANAQMSIGSAGEHNITVWMREDGIHLDRILLTTDAGFVPSGGGPAESPRAGGGPTAVIAATPQAGVAPLVVDFDGGGSVPPLGASIVGYSWDFGDGNTGFGSSISHTYTTDGTFTASLVVEDSNGGLGATTVSITVDPAPVDDPVAAFTATPATGTAPLVVDYDGSASQPPAGASIISYTWDFGDGNTGSGEFITHTYQDAGTYTATLTVEDSNGNTDAATTSITVDPATSINPVAAFSADPVAGTVPLEVAFDASASTPPDGETLTGYTWDFGNSETGTGETVSHTFTATGSFDVTLTVEASNGNTDTETVTITVNPVPAEDAMHISSVATAIVRGSGNGTVEATVVIVDEDGSPVEAATVSGQFSEDLTGTDTAVTNSDGTAVLISDAFTTRPNDLGFCVDAVTHASLVYDPAANDDPSFACEGTGGNAPPVAAFSVSTTLLEASFTDNSTDVDGDVVAWSWDLGDGTSSTDQNPVHTYAANGTYTVSLTVTDDAGATGTASQSVTVNDGTASPTMHIESITTAVVRASGSGSVEATFLIHDEGGNPVQDVSISGMFSGDLSGTDTGITDNNGEAVLISDNFSTRPSLLEICADAVTHASLVYDAAQNSDGSFDCATAALSETAGGSDFLQIEAESVAIPETFSLTQNYPNPFNPVTNISYDLPDDVDVRLTVYNVLGQVVRELVNTRQPAGSYVVPFDANHLSAGIYIYRIEAGAFSSSRQMLLLK